jgi:hypothetical protein
MVTKVNIPNPLDTIEGAVDAFDDLADTIANPPEGRPLRGAIGRAGQMYCNYLGAVPGAALGLLGPGFVVGSLLCKPYWEKNNFSEPVPTGGVVGGQCDKVYTFFAQRRTSTAGFSTVQNTSRRGPITGIAKVKNGGGSFIDRYTITGPNVVGANVDISYSSGGDTRLLGPFLSGTSTPDFECGDGSSSGFQPGQNPPPNPGPWPTGEEPGTRPTGEPFFTVPPIDVPGDPGDPIELPDDPLGGGDGAGGGEPPGGLTGADGGTGGGGDEDFGEPPEGERWVGCCITITTEPPGLGIIPSSLPESIYPEVLGNVRLAFDGGGGVGYDTPIQIRQKTTCVWEPVRGMAPTGCRVNVKPGTSYSIRKYSVLEED